MTSTPTIRTEADAEALAAAIRTQLLRDDIGTSASGDKFAPDSPSIPWAHSSTWADIFNETLSALPDECAANIAAVIGEQIGPRSYALSQLLAGIAKAAYNAGHRTGLRQGRTMADKAHAQG